MTPVEFSGGDEIADLFAALRTVILDFTTRAISEGDPKQGEAARWLTAHAVLGHLASGAHVRAVNLGTFQSVRDEALTRVEHVAHALEQAAAEYIAKLEGSKSGGRS